MGGVNLLVDGNVDKMWLLNLTIDVASVAANLTAEQTFTLNGVKVGDYIQVNKPTLSAGLGVSGARASAANQIAITFNNNTAAPIDPASQTYIVFIARPNQQITGIG